MSGGTVSQQQPLAPLTDVTGCLSWRTPSSQEPGITTGRLTPIDGGELGGMNRHFDKATGRMAQIGLTQQVQLRQQWATPRVDDSKNNGSKSQIARHGPALNAQVGGQLNPDWVETLMGFPPGWTEVGKQESPVSPAESLTGWTGCDASETP